ncbi:hypothetical protein [Desulfurispira natronophila]|uniref:Cell division protein FtsL n=1 Tax=Desulfurispira natronophila TaxID=682562 RepID=A0A7W7Y4K2_9BACT|nr:hypothetical protein [Desulfurispira natronophila]MBB5021970.1 hypothetical protein [Desulfurispira natronophila]
MAVFPFRATSRDYPGFRRLSYILSALLIITTIVLSLWIKTKIIAAGYDVAQLQREVLEEEGRLGLLEARLYELSFPGNIGALAREHEMVYPAADQLEYLQDGTIVGARDLAN